MPLQKPGEIPNRPGEYIERGPRGGQVPNPRKVTIEEGDRPLPPTQEPRAHLGTRGPAPLVKQVLRPRGETVPQVTPVALVHRPGRLAVGTGPRRVPEPPPPWRLRMWRLFVSVVLVPVAINNTTAEATTVLVYVQQNEILFAADSRGVIRGRPTTDGMCKVRNFGEIAFAASGTMSRFVANQVEPDFSLFRIATVLQRATPGEMLSTRIDRFASALMEAFAKSASLTRDIFAQKEEPTTYLLGFFDQERPVVFSRKLPHNEADNFVDVGVLIKLGMQDAIGNESVAANEVDVHARLVEIIQIQARSTPDKVGGPVDVLRLTADGSEWLEKKPGCPELG